MDLFKCASNFIIHIKFEPESTDTAKVPSSLNSILLKFLD
jgi:hypothetical protein